MIPEKVLLPAWLKVRLKLLLPVEMFPAPLMPPEAISVSLLADVQATSLVTVIFPVPAPAFPVLVVVMVTLPLAKAVSIVDGLMSDTLRPELGLNVPLLLVTDAVPVLLMSMSAGSNSH